MPYWIWLVLPRIFPGSLPGPGGYASLGLARRRTATRCRSVSRRSPSASRASASTAPCATRPACRAAAGRAADDRRGGAPRTRRRRRSTCASSFAPRVRPTLQRRHASSPRSPRTRGCRCVDRLLYRFAIIPAHAAGAAAAARRERWMASRPDWGRGRIDPFNPVKFGILEQPSTTRSATPTWCRSGTCAARGHGVPLGRTEHRSCAKSCSRRRSATGPRSSGSDRDYRALGRDRPAAHVEPAPRHELHQRAAAAEVPAADRQRAGAPRAPASTGRMRRVPRVRAARGPARSSRSRRSAPTGIGSTCGRTACGRRPTTRTARATRGSSRSSGRPTATSPCRSTACGCAARTCTTDRCRRWRTCSSRPRRGRRSSGAATTSSIRCRSAS